MLLEIALALDLAVEKPSKPSRFARYSYYAAGHALDIASTAYCESKGCTEGNKIGLVDNTKERIISKAFGVIILAEADHYLTRKKHKKTKWAVRIIAGGAHLWVAQRNYRLGKKRENRLKGY